MIALLLTFLNILGMDAFANNDQSPDSTEQETWKSCFAAQYIAGFIF